MRTATPLGSRQLRALCALVALESEFGPRVPRSQLLVWIYRWRDEHPETPLSVEHFTDSRTKEYTAANAHLSRTLLSLERRGLVKRHQGGGARVELTELGRETAQEIASRFNGWRRR